jgi:hypothetical protein
MIMDEKQQKIEAIKESIGRKINYLISAKSSGRVELTVILNITQGYIGSADLRNDSKENIFK